MPEFRGFKKKNWGGVGVRGGGGGGNRFQVFICLHFVNAILNNKMNTV